MGAVRKRSVLLTNMIAVRVIDRSEIALKNVDFTQNDFIISKITILMAVHIGPAAAFPLPPPCRGFASVLEYYVSNSSCLVRTKYFIC